MKAFVVYLNGKRLCAAGVGTNGVLTTNITWAGGGPKRTADDHLGFHVGGLDSRTGEHLDWSVPELKVGDRVSVKIIETEQIDRESRRYIPDLAGAG